MLLDAENGMEDHFSTGSNEDKKMNGVQSDEDDQGTTIPAALKSTSSLDHQQDRSSSLRRSQGNELQISTCESSSSFMSFIFKWWFSVIVSYIIPVDICGLVYSAINPVTRRRHYGEHGKEDGRKMKNPHGSKTKRDEKDDSSLVPLIAKLENEKSLQFDCNETNAEILTGSSKSKIFASKRSLLSSNGNSLVSSSDSSSQSHQDSGRSLKSTNNSFRSSGNSQVASNRSLTSSNNTSYRTARNEATLPTPITEEEDTASLHTFQTAGTIATSGTKSELTPNMSLRVGNMDEYRKRLSEMYMRSEGRSAQTIDQSTDKKEKESIDAKKSEIGDDSHTQAKNDTKQENDEEKNRKQVTIDEKLPAEPSNRSLLNRKPSSRSSKRNTGFTKQQSERSHVHLESIDLEEISTGHMSHLSIDSQSGNRLRSDSYTFLMIKKTFHRAWLVGIATFFIQVLRLSLILYGRDAPASKDTIFQIPFNISFSVRATQFIAIFFSILVSSHDFFKPIKECKVLWRSNKKEWSTVVSRLDQQNDDVDNDDADDDDEQPLVVLVTDNSSSNSQDGSEPDQPKVHSESDGRTWLLHIVVPNLLRFILAIYVSMLTFIIIIQSKTIPDLVLNVLAVQVIGRLHFGIFYLAKYGYLGKNMKTHAILAKKLRVPDTTSTKCFAVPLRLIIFLTLFTTSICVYGPITSGQLSGSILRTKYPNCKVNDPDKISKISDGVCHGGTQNSIECGFDGGDCIDFNKKFPKCMVENTWEIGNGHCDEEHNTGRLHLSWKYISHVYQEFD